jgi:hypothetical protein
VNFTAETPRTLRQRREERKSLRSLCALRDSAVKENFIADPFDSSITISSLPDNFVEHILD